MSDLTVEVTRCGKPVTDLQPYLGSFGHLVAAAKAQAEKECWKTVSESRAATISPMARLPGSKSSRVVGSCASP
jgi:hypothetical protein